MVSAAQPYRQLACAVVITLMSGCAAPLSSLPQSSGTPEATSSPQATPPAANPEEPPPATDEPEGEPQATPSLPEQEHISGEWRRYVSPKGYEIVIPADMVPVESDPDFTRFRVAEVTVLLISIGDTSGDITLCNFSPCSQVHVTGTHQLGRALEVYPAHPFGFSEFTTKITLDGRPARLEAPTPSRYLVGPTAYVHAYSVINDRPVALRFTYSYRSRDDVPTSMQQKVISSFRLHAAQQLPMTEYVFPHDGFAISLPKQWVARRTLTPGRTQVFWQPRGRQTQWVMTINIGPPDGRIAGCSVGRCQPARVTTLDELQDALRSSSSLLSSWPEISGDMAFGGEPARYERPKPINNCLGCPGTRYHVFAFHRGQPVVLAFDYWPLRFNRLGADSAWTLAQEIVDSFRFLD